MIQIREYAQNMFGKKKNILVKVELCGLLYLNAKADGYDLDKGIRLEIPDKTKLKKALESIGLSKSRRVIIYVNGEKAALSKKLRDGDKIFCFSAASGG